jgi:hypothetical protein
MGVPTQEVGYTSATTGRGEHEVHKGLLVALGGGRFATKALPIRAILQAAVDVPEGEVNNILYLKFVDRAS